MARRLKTVSEAGSLEPPADPTMGRLPSVAFKDSQPEVWTCLRDTIVGVSPQGLAQYAQALQAFNVAELLPRVKAPTLAVCGDGDVATQPAEAQRIVGLVPGARYVEIAQAPHYPNVEQSERFNGLLVNWLNAQPAA